LIPVIEFLSSTTRFRTWWSVSRHRRPISVMLLLVRAAWTMLALALLAGAAGCDDKTKALLVMPYDAGFDATLDAGATDAPAEAEGDGGPLGGPCKDDSQCDDGVACTFDSCDPALLRCRNVPDDTRCDDGVYCDGREVCDPLRGCVAGAVVTCDDGDPCTIDRCIEATKSCQHDPRDLDLDGDPDTHCFAHHDCNDLDPTVASTHAEVCQNHKDDNCNGQIDEMPCVGTTGDTCAAPFTVQANATTPLSTVGANKDYAYACALSQAGARDVVAAVTVPQGPNADLDVWVTTQGGADATIAIESACGDPSTLLACGSGGTAPASAVRARARDIAPGTYFIVVTTIGETSFDLEVTLLAPTPKPTNDTCQAALPVATDTPFTVSIIDPARNLPSACPSSTGELTYAFTVAQPEDVRVYASTTQGSGTPVVSLRDTRCTGDGGEGDELFCNASPKLPLFVRALPAGTYVLAVSATSPIDASVDVATAPATAALPDETCTAPPAATANATAVVDLSSHEEAIQDGCDPGGPTAARDVSLASTSDVLLVARFPETEQGGLSFDTPVCNAPTRLACQTGTTPVRIGRRSVPAGDYRAVLTDQIGAQASLTTLVRDAVPPTSVANADTCPVAFVIPPAGGFFTGDTTSATANYPGACDAAGQPASPDQVLSLTLAQPQRVVFDMEGSTYTTLLDVRTGPACPGDPVMNGCYVGFGPARSFLDLELPAGQYFVFVEGYAGGKGAWNLDVRVVPP
jgi:hypothetical protein